MIVHAIPGWGFSSKIFSALSTSDLTFCDLDYIDIPEIDLNSIAKRLACNIPDKANVLAWSFGGLIAIKLASLYPNKVKKLILISSQAKLFSDPNEANHFSKEFIENTENQIDRFIKLVNFPNRNSINKKTLINYFLHQQKEKLTQLLPILINADLKQDYMNLNVDILHIINKEDAIIKQCEHELNMLNPKIKIAILEKSGHAGFLSHPSDYQHIIRSFFSC